MYCYANITLSLPHWHLAQIPVAMCIVLVHMLALTLARPYTVINNNYLAIFVDIQLLLTFFMSLLIQVDEGYESVLFPIGFDNTFVLVMLLTTNIR